MGKQSALLLMSRSFAILPVWVPLISIFILMDNLGMPLTYAEQ